MSLPLPKTNGDPSLAPFDGGYKYESWLRLAAIQTGTNQVPSAVVLEAPQDTFITQPYAFLHRNPDTGLLTELTDGDHFLLAIRVAHLWAGTETLDDLEQSDIAGLLTVFSLVHIDRDTAFQVHNALTIGLGIGQPVKETYTPN